MANSKKYLVSVEVLKYPYCGKSIESEEFLSEKVCLRIIAFRKINTRMIQKVAVVVVLVLGLRFGKVKSADAIGLPILPAPVTRLQPSYERPFEVKSAKIIARKNDRIAYKSNRKILYLIYLTDPRVSSNEQVLKIVKDFRGGSWGLLGTLGFLGLIILIFSMSEGFVPNLVDPGWGLDRPNPFQPPSSQHRFPPYYDLFLPRRTCYADHTGSFPIMAEGYVLKLNLNIDKHGRSRIIYFTIIWTFLNIN